MDRRRGVVLVLAIGLQFVFPYLQRIGTHPIRSQRLAAQIRTLEQREHVGRPDDPRCAGARTRRRQRTPSRSGIGPSRSVFIWDTMLDGRFSFGEVRFVLAHELGHLARWHIWKGIAWGALFGIPILALVALVTGRRGGLRRPENVPLALLTIAVAGIAVTPFANAVSRRYEAEADWMALQRDARPGGGAGAVQGVRDDGPAEPGSARLGACLPRGSPERARARRAGRGLAPAEPLVVVVASRRRFGKVPDPFLRRPLREGVLHRREQLLEELLRHVHA